MATATDLLAGADLPPLDSAAERTAELLVVLAHRCVDWEVWSPRALRYWDALTDRVRTCCYAGPALADWWDSMGRRMTLDQPRSAQERALLVGALASDDDRQVLDVLRRHADALVLRCRVAVEPAKERRENEQ